MEVLASDWLDVFSSLEGIHMQKSLVRLAASLFVASAAWRYVDYGLPPLTCALALVQACLWGVRGRDESCAEICGFVPRAPSHPVLTKAKGTWENMGSIAASTEIKLATDFSIAGSGQIPTPVPPVQSSALRRWNNTFWKVFIITV